MKAYKTLYLFLLSIVLLACGGNEVSSYEDYVKWLNDEDNGLVMNKKVDGITIRLKYIPSDYLAYQDLSGEKSVKKEAIDSIISGYQKSLTFLMTIGVDGKIKKGDVMYQDVTNYEEYKQKLYAMNFEVEQLTTLTLNNKKYKPVLSSLENVYGLTESRNITLVFVPESENEQTFYTSEKLQLSYDDEIFNTGMNHFTFNREDIKNAPTFIFWN